VAKVNGRRRYDSTLRKQQAALTRSRILDAAQRLFGDRGYTATTMEAIAAEAGVATDTVYAGFRNKPGVLHSLIDLRVGGDAAPVALLDRERPRAIQAQRDQARQVAGFAADVAAIMERARPVDDIIRGAAEVDPVIAALRRQLQLHRYENMRQFVGWLADNGPLRGGMSLDEAAAIVWTQTSPEVHRLLRAERAWTAERYRDWLSETLSRTLLV
jgi:AcrR family transcriptional regulator